MNTLNSVLFEGKVTAQQDNIIIVQGRFHNEDVQSSVFIGNVKAFEKLDITERFIRIVGRLANSDNGLMLIAEHIKVEMEK